MSEWRPIDSAPKDERVLIFVPGWGTNAADGVFLAEWQREGYWQPEYAEVTMLDEPCDWPTHWMPLPNPPR